jgi:hypothetical protein
VRYRFHSEVPADQSTEVTAQWTNAFDTSSPKSFTVSPEYTTGRHTETAANVSDCAIISGHWMSTPLERIEVQVTTNLSSILALNKPSNVTMSILTINSG